MSISMYRWEHVPWETIERQVFKLQKRIYQASQARGTHDKGQAIEELDELKGSRPVLKTSE